MTAAEVAAMPDGRFVRTAGLVLLRQHPVNANRVTFMTLEDETGHVNLVVWERVALAHRRAMLQSRLLEVHGRLQRQDEVMHLIVHRMVDRSALVRGLAARSRDFK